MPSSRSLTATTTFALALAAAASGAAGAQALRGSPASVEKMYHFAVRQGLAFYQTPDDVSAAAERGRLVQLAGGPGWDLSSGVGWAFATPEAVAFLDQLGPEYERNCGAPMVVTSATRPRSKSPRNGHPQTVHPTGIAVDLRKPYRGPCLDWLRQRLSELESAGRIEATEERRPPHFHIAVMSRPGSAPRRSATALAASSASVGRQMGTSGNVPWGAAMNPRGTSFSNPMLNSALSPFGRRLPILAGAMVMAQRPARATMAPTSSVTVTASAGSIAPVSSDSGSTYVVRPGDTLWEIARKHGVTVDQLIAANKLGRRGVLRPRMELRIPGERAAN